MVCRNRLTSQLVIAVSLLSVRIDTSCKELDPLAKRTRMNHLLDKMLKQCIVTRWNSVLHMLKSLPYWSRLML